LKEIETSSRILGNTAKRILDRNILLEESVEPTNHFRALQRRIDDFVRSLGIGPLVIYTASFYSIYHILRYKEIPFTGIK
jgi:hypothetical protein